MNHYARDERKSTGDAADPLTRGVLLFVGVAALLAGLYGRFKGLGTWSLGVDEFYISRSIDNVLKSGLPAFPCGGYYTRGLVFQYLVAGLRLLGWSPEFAGRFVAALSSLLLLPAVFLLGRRLRSPLAGWLTVILLCISVWEIEMARFARMYAPFQALFAWYLIAYLRFTSTRELAALAWMVVLSMLGVLVWEGGVLLGVANLVAVVAASRDGRVTRREVLQLVALTALVYPLYLATRDLRIFADMPAASGVVDAPDDPLSQLAVWFAPLMHHPLWAAALVVPLAASLPALRWLASFRDRPLLCVALGAVLAAAAVHAFLAAAAVLLVLALLGWVDRRTLTSAGSRSWWRALAAFAVFWLIVMAAYDGLARHLVPGNTPQAGDLQILRDLVGFPNIYDHVLRPWLRTLPLLALGLFAGFATLCGWCIARSGASPVREPIAAVSSLIIVLLLVIGSTTTDRIETRYTYFLYPVLLLLAVGVVLRVAQAVTARYGLPAALAACVPLLCFAGTEDFQPRHVARVDSEAINFRVGMPSHAAEHYYPRNDIGGVARWLAANVRPGDLVLTGVPSLDQYYHRADYFFLDDDDVRYEAYVCPDDKTERWTNLPVVYSVAGLRPLVASHRRVFASVFATAERRLRDRAAEEGWSITRVWRAGSGTADVILIEEAPAG